MRERSDVKDYNWIQGTYIYIYSNIKEEKKADTAVFSMRTNRQRLRNRSKSDFFFFFFVGGGGGGGGGSQTITHTLECVLRLLFMR